MKIPPIENISVGGFLLEVISGIENLDVLCKDRGVDLLIFLK